MKSATTTPKAKTSSMSSTTTPRQPKFNSVMKSHMSELHAKVQSIPPTPHLKRFKVSSTDYRDYVTPSTMQQKYSYTPLKEKLKRNYALSNPSSSSYSTPSTSGSMPSTSFDIQDGFSCEENHNDDLQFLSMDDFCDFEDEWNEEDTVPQIVPDSTAAIYFSDTSRLTTQYQSTPATSPKQVSLPSPVKHTTKSSSFMFQAPQLPKVLSDIQLPRSSVYSYSSIDSAMTLPSYTQRKRPLSATGFDQENIPHLFSSAGVSSGASGSAQSPAKQLHTTATAPTSKSPAWMKPVPQR